MVLVQVPRDRPLSPRSRRLSLFSIGDKVRMRDPEKCQQTYTVVKVDWRNRPKFQYDIFENESQETLQKVQESELVCPTRDSFSARKVDDSQIKCGPDGESLPQQISQSNQDNQLNNAEEIPGQVVEEMATARVEPRKSDSHYARLARRAEEYFRRHSRESEPPGDSHSNKGNQLGSSIENNTSADHSSGNREGTQAKSNAGDNFTSHH
ncbi:hypothetical protein IWZ01DRAFT_494703 [Phyllosticta capitalensis]